MPKKRIIILITVFMIVLILAVAIGLLILGRQTGAPLPVVGPTVLITSPTPRENTAASPGVEIQASAYGENPIHHLELWLDGELSQTFYNQNLEQASALNISFNQPLSSGGHLLFVRAVDTHNLIGQSLPVTAEGTLNFSGDGPFSLVQVQEGDTLDQTLEAIGTDLAAVLPFNPGLGSEASAGTTIAIPIPPETGSPPAGNPAQPPAKPTILDLIKLFPIGNPPLALFPVQVAGPPSAPTDLQVNIDGCTIELTWNDTSEYEAGFQIWVTGLGLPPHIAARTKAAQGTGLVSIELEALSKGDYVYWVEAYNTAGAQPSNQTLAAISDSCPNQFGGKLLVETLDFSAPGEYDRAYCYVSLQDNPEIRLPAGKDQFIHLTNGQGDISTLPAASRSFSLPDPGNQDIKVSGECWGWAGASLTKLGGFSQAITPAQWGASRIAIPGGIFEVGLQVSYSLPGGDLVPFAAPNPGIAPPRILSYEAPFSAQDVGLDPMDAINYLAGGNLRTLTWEWFPLTADSPPLTGFTVLINGIPFKQISSPAERSTVIEVPGFCGTKLEISLVANLDDQQSLPSNSVTDQQPDCTLYAVVNFERVWFGWTNDTFNPANKCDTLQSYFDISVTEIFDQDNPDEIQGFKQVKYFWGGDYFVNIRCGIYNLDDLAGPYYAKKELHPTQITFPLRPLEGHSTSYQIIGNMWDDDDLSGDDLVAHFDGSFHVNPNMVEGLLNQMSGSPKMIRSYYCDTYVGTFDGDAKSGFDVCVHLYADNPSTGASTVPSNAPLTVEPAADAPPVAGAVKRESDLNLVDLFIDNDGHRYLRVRNEGPQDLVQEKIDLVASLQTDDPNFHSQHYTKTYYLTLKKGARTDLEFYTDRFDPSQYSYTLMVEATPDRFSDPNLSNNDISKVITASDFQLIPDSLITDFQITAIKADGSEKFRVEVLNGGPDITDNTNLSQGTVTCEATQVSRLDGTSTKITGLEITDFLTLNSGQKIQLYPVKEGFEFNQLLNWYIISCQVKQAGNYTDPNPANNFLTEIVQ